VLSKSLKYSLLAGLIIGLYVLGVIDFSFPRSYSTTHGVDWAAQWSLPANLGPIIEFLAKPDYITSEIFFISVPIIAALLAFLYVFTRNRGFSNILLILFTLFMFIFLILWPSLSSAIVGKMTDILSMPWIIYLAPELIYRTVLVSPSLPIVLFMRRKAGNL
jgi:hypothetical protein